MRRSFPTFGPPSAPKRCNLTVPSKVHLGHILTVTGRNFLRFGERDAGTPRRKPQRLPFARLIAEPLAA